MIKAGRRIIRFKNNILHNFVWDNEELPEQWKESIIVRVYKVDAKKDGISCRGNITSSSTRMYEILSNILRQ